MGIFARELSLLYPALRDGEPCSLPEPPIQYADFAAWQRDHLDGPALDDQLSYWKRQLVGAPERQQLPAERPRSGEPSGRGERLSFAFSPGLERTLREVGRRDKATLFMVLLAGFSVLLYRGGTRKETLVGIPLAGRNRTETEDLIGCFINTAVVRTDLDGNPRFRDVLTQVRDTALGAYAHQDVPFERVVRAVRPRRTAGSAPLVRALFDFQNIPPRPPLEIEGLEVEPIGAELATAKLDLVVDMWEREEGLAGSVEFSTDLFEAADVHRLVRGFETLLADVAGDPDRRIDSLSTTSEEERRASARSRRDQSRDERERFARIKPKAIKLPGGQS
jgi:non-ribosomal peptide synthetase component F